MRREQLRELAAFEAHLLRKGRAEGTVRKYLPCVARFLEVAGDRAPGSLSVVEIEHYLDQWYHDFVCRYGHKPAEGTQRSQVTSLKAYFAFLERGGRLVDKDGRAARNNMALIDTPKRSQKPIDFLSPEEDAALLDYDGEPHEIIIVWLLRETGIRVGELCQLQISDVDLREARRETLRIRKSKTSAGLRTVPLSPDLVVMLERWLERLRADGLYRPDGPLVPTRKGGEVCSSWVWRLLKRVAANAGVRAVACTCGTTTVYGHARECPRTVNGENRSRISPHTLRRTYATDLLNRGASIEVVSKLLGHASVQVTQQAYAELLDERVWEEFNEARGYRIAA